MALLQIAFRSSSSASRATAVTVNRINQLSARTQAQAIMGAATPVDDILEKLREWLDRLLSALTQIVAKLAGATAFSVTVGSAVSVTVDFGPE